MDIDATYGAALIGLVLASVLYGVTLLQTFLYYRQYPTDSVFTKGLVFVVWLLDTAHLVLITVSMHWYLITNYNTPDALSKATWSQNLQIDCNGLIGLIVQCFFAQRVRRLSGNMWLTVLATTLITIHFALGIVFTVKSFILVDTSKFKQLTWVTSAGLGSAAAADMIMAGALSYYLLKSRTGFKQTDSLITTLIAYSLTTGTITSVIAFMAVVTFATMPTNYTWLAFFWILGKCHVNSFLAALNSRNSLRNQAANHDPTFLQLSPMPATSLMTTGDLGEKPLGFRIPKTDYDCPTLPPDVVSMFENHRPEANK